MFAPLLLTVCLFPIFSSAHWGLVIDAGSSGSRIHIYQWANRSDISVDPNITEYIPTASADQNALQNTLPISGYTSNPSMVTQSLAPLLTQAQRWVPVSEYSKTPLILRATAGMRLLNTTEQNDIFDAIRTMFNDATQNPFKFQSSYASIASGEQEAAWSWVMANYVSGLLKPNTPSTAFVSTMDLGGASTQMDFIPTDELLGNEFSLTVFGRPISLFAHSYLLFGQDQFLLRLRALAVQKQSPNTTIQFPCWHKDFTDYWLYNGVNYTFNGTSDYNSCYWNYTQPLFGFNAECIQPPCSFMGVYQPRLPQNQVYWAISAYFYTVNGMGMVGWNGAANFTVAQIEAVGVTHCAKNWSQAQIDDPNDPYLLNYCFSSTLVNSLLRAQGAEFVPVYYARKAYGQSVGWPVGALIDELNLLPLDLSPSKNSAFTLRSTIVPVALFLALMGMLT